MNILSKKQKSIILILLSLLFITVVYILKINDYNKTKKDIRPEDVSLEYGNYYCIRSEYNRPGIENTMGPIEPYKENIDKTKNWKYDKKFKQVKEQNKLFEPYILKIEEMGFEKEGMHYIRYMQECSMTLSIDLTSQHPYEDVKKEEDNLFLIASYIDKSKVDVKNFAITYKNAPIDYNNAPVKIYIDVEKFLHAKTKNERIHIIRASNQVFFGRLLYADMKKIENKRFTIITGIQDYSNDSFWTNYSIDALYNPEYYYEKDDYLKEDILLITNLFKKNANKYSFFTNPKEIIGKQEFMLTITRKDNEKGIDSPKLVFTMEDFKNDKTLNAALKREFSKTENKSNENIFQTSK